MKNWNQIEQQLRTATPREDFPAGLHDRIVRAVRDDRAAATVTTPDRQRNFASFWLMGGAFGIAVLAMGSALIFGPSLLTESEPVASAPGFSLAAVEAFADDPMQNEVEALRADILATARYVAAYLPDTTGG